MTSKERLGSLDGLRGLAALAVVMYHYTYRYHELYGHQLESSMLSLFKYGHLGVQLFFIISGFVIYLSIQHTDTLKRFFVNRFSRLYPAYWLSIILTFIIVTIFGLPGREVNFEEMLVNLTMLNGFVGIRSVDGVYWTLRVELTFYIGIAILYFLVPKNYIYRTLILILLLTISIKLTQQYLFVDNKALNILIYLFSIDYLHFFGAGIGFYLVYSRKCSMSGYVLIAISLLHILIFQSQEEKFITLSLYLIFFMTITQRLTFLNSALFKFLGVISYPMYLLHQNIGYVIINYTYDAGLNGYFGIISSLIFCSWISYVVYIHIERKIGPYMKEKLMAKEL